MKRFNQILIITILVCLPSVVYGQRDADDAVIKIFNKYEDREGVESITISPTLLGLMKDGKTNDKKTQELISKINGLRIMTINDGAGNKGRTNSEALIAELQAVVKKDFEEIMKMKNSNERLELYVRNTPNCKDCKGALLFISTNTAYNSFSAIYLSGTIDKALIDAVMNGEIGISKNK